MLRERAPSTAGAGPTWASYYRDAPLIALGHPDGFHADRKPTNRPNSELKSERVHHLRQPVVTSHEDGD